MTMGINMFPITRRKGKNGVKIEKGKALNDFIDNSVSNSYLNI